MADRLEAADLEAVGDGDSADEMKEMEMIRSWARRVTVLSAGLCVIGAYGQTVVPQLGSGGTAKLRQTDFTVLELHETRHDLPCTVVPLKPQLDWDFLFHTGYTVHLPLTSLVGNGHDLTVLFRVTPQDHPDDTAYMVQKLRVPAVEEGSKGNSELYGVFTLGEGKYHIDWLMRDEWERFCAMSWDLDVKLNPKEAQLKQWVPQSLVQPLGPLFAEELPVTRPPGTGLPRLNVVVNFDPADPAAARLDARDVDVLVATLRRIGSDPRFGSYSVVACSFDTQQVFYQQDSANGIDIPALGVALGSLKLGLVDAKRLATPKGPGQFATDIIRERIKEDSPDALVVLGRKAGRETGVPREALEALEKPGIPVFYMSYIADQESILRRDPVSSIVKRLGGVEYSMTRPKDLFTAWTDVVFRIQRMKRSSQALMVVQAASR